LALGPGLVVNTILKDHWGRARPHQILVFGGDAHFTPAVLMADQCARNCSFPSGHAALGFWLVAVAMVVPPRWRCLAMGCALAIGALVGAMRIAQGAHFLSDVIAAALIVVGINCLLGRLILGRETIMPR
jgi:lipid A 4'-phosphatase